jgi:Tol biopolymer transport system component
MTRFLLRLIAWIMVICAGIVLLALGIGHILPPEAEALYNGNFFPLTSNIYRMNMRRQIKVQLTYDLGSEQSIGWSKDGQQIAFVSAGETGSAIELMDTQGHLIKILASDLNQIKEPSWSPDNRYIAYIHQPSDYYQLMLLDVKTAQAQPLTDVSYNLSEAIWSPDSTQIVFSSFNYADNQRSIYVVNIKTGSITLLAKADLLITSMTWLPDHDQIIFLSYTQSNQQFEVHTLDTQTGKIDLLLTGAASPTLSVDGHSLLYINVNNLSSLDLLDMTSGNSTTLYSGPIVATSLSSWSPDGHYVLYTYFDIPDTRVYQIDVIECLRQPKDCTLVLISNQGYFGHFQWRPQQP